MYKLISVCLALSMVFGDISSAKHQNADQAELKKAKTSSDPNIQFLEVSKKSKKTRIDLKSSQTNLVKKTKTASSKQKEMNSAQLLNKGQESEFTVKSNKEHIKSEEILSIENRLKKDEQNDLRIKVRNFVQGAKNKAGNSGLQLLTREHEDLFFSEYAEGSSNNKYLEIYNSTSETVDLTQYAYPNVSNGPSEAGTHEWWNTFDDGATVAAGDVYVICHGSADDLIQAECDETHSYLSNGDDGYALIKGTEDSFEVLDVIGQNIYESTYDDPGSGWDVAGVTNGTVNHTLVRKSSVQEGNTDWSASSGTSADDSEWIVLDIDVWDNLGSHTMDVEEEGVYFAEDFEGDFPPASWTLTGEDYWGGSTVWAQDAGDDYGPGFAASGSYSAFYNDYDYPSALSGAMISPDIDLTSAVSPTLYFAYWDGNGSDYVDVQVSNADGSYTSVYTTPLATTGWEDLEVDLTSYVGQVVSIRFVGTSVYGVSNPHVDNIVVSEPPTYPIADVSTGSIDFGSTFVGGSKSIDFAISNTGGSDLNATATSDNAKFVVSTLPGRISPGETVQVTVTYSPTEEMDDAGSITITHNGDTSPDVVTVSGSGSLNIIDEGFDGPWTGDPAAPAGWTVVNSDGDGYTWTQANTYISEVNGFAAHGMGNQDDWLISPTFTANGNYKLKWWDVVESSSYNNTYDVYVFPGGDISAGVNLGTYDCVNTDLVQHDIDLSAYNGQSISVGFHQTFSAATFYGFGIEDVTVEPIPTTAVIVLGSQSLDFGSVFLSSSKQITLTVANEGGAEATGTISSDNDKFVVPATFTVAANGTQDIVVTYTPTTEGADAGSITLTHNGASSPDVVAVSGVGSLDIITEGFDGPWTGDPAAPAGWTVVNSDADGYTWTQANTYISFDVNGFAAHGMGNQDDWLISPTFTPSGGYGLYWWDVVESPSYNNTYDVYVFPGGDVSAGVNLGTYDCVNTDLTEHFVSLAAYDGQAISVGFHQTFSAATFYGFGIEDVRVSPLPVTPIIAVSTTQLGFMATAIGATDSQSLGITNTGSGDLEGTVVYSDGFTGTASFSASDASISISFAPTTSGLISGTATISSNGGEDIVVALSGNSGSSVATWDEDVDGDGYADWPVGWQTINYDGNGDGWQFYGGAGAHTGTGYTSAGEDGSGTINSDWLVSPKYSVSAGDVFSFYASDDGGSSSYPDIMTVHVSPTGAGAPTDFTVELDSVINMGSAWLPYSYDLSSYVGTEIRLAIVYRGEWGYALNVDDIAGPEIVIEAGPVLSDYPYSLDFAAGGTIDVGSTATLVFDYFNSGGSDLEVSSVTFEGPFSLDSDVTLPIVTASGSIGSFGVVFSPTEDGVVEGSMVIASNAGDDITIPLYGSAFGGVYREDFGYVGEDGYLTPWSAGWMFSDDGVMCPTDQACSNGTGESWSRASISGQGLMYHNYNTATDADTAISAAITLPELADGYHYELDTEEYMSYGSDANDVNGFAISTDGGASFTLIGEPDYSASGVHSNNYDLTGYDGQTVHIALVYKGTYAQAWGVLTMEIRAKEDPVIPIFAHTKAVFPVTALGESFDKKIYYQNVGAGNLTADITYPASMTGPASITDLAPGVLDSMVVTYTPSTAGIELGDIVVDGSASGAAVVSLGVEANAGELAFDMVSRNAGWKQYSLGGETWVAPSGSVYPGIWRWWGGTGHGSANYYGVYSYPGYWGGVDDYLVSPRYNINDASEVLSFFTRGGDETERDSINVWVSTEEPIMGSVYDLIGEGGIVDTGFVNTDAFSLAFESLPTNLGGEWDPVNIDLSSYSTDVWVMIQSVQYYDDAGEPSGWMLQVDDLGTPDIYMNPNPVLYVGKEYDFGVTQPSGDSVRYYLRNTGMQDLVIDDMGFENGDYFDVAYNSTFPITIVPGGIDSIDVYWMPQESGVQVDTLVYYSNYTVGDVDAFGNGTDHSVFIAEAFNAPPSPVALIGPADETVLTIDGSNAEGQTGIFWTNSTDPDGYPIEYFLELIVENTGDTLDTLISQSNFFLSHEEVLEYMTEVGVTELDIMWDVYAYDGFEDVESSNGPWSLTIDGGWALSVDNNTLPEVFALHNNYPNPFNPITNIRYDIPEASDVRIDIYDLVGKKVKTLVSKQHQPGRYKIQWNATNEFGSAVATGMYIYKIQAKDFVSVKKLLLMK